ncbi:gluconate 2-dehydrogenase subunit 3 family protein [Entomohabitans teleogrylli]|uniref:gluconate 2-dehydrogenase subunit 3 family protein n=1 Tax=Entomohabitans teleogrylli TaxID=1384589 RepID=UPI00073DA8D9|nr:gluconate 2-dehydrogenase subunit 3 family protein [Entomohabitans teleogrylli]
MRKPQKTLPGVTRRQVLAWSGAALALGTGSAKAITITGTPGWQPFSDNPPETFSEPHWLFLNDAEVATLEAIVDRLIPEDELSPGGKEAGCAVFIDRQLHGFYGNFERLYMEGPFQQGTPEQGDQSPLTPRQRYRIGLAAIDNHCQKQFSKPFHQLSAEQQDTLLQGLEKGDIKLEGIDSQQFFAQVLNNTTEGFFADPIYGGNRDMVSWKMIGFPGARYDYRDFIDRHNEDLHLAPVSINGGPEWNNKKG